MITRFFLFIFALSSTAAAVFGAERPAGRTSRALITEYRPDRLKTLAEDGGTVAIQFHSESCEVCLRQEAVLSGLISSKTSGVSAILQADFDTEENLRLFYRVTTPSTLLLFQGEELIARKGGLETEDEIRTFFREELSRQRGRPGPRPKAEIRPKR